MLDSTIKIRVFFFFFFFGSVETMVIIAHYSFLTHMNVKKLELKINLIQF